MKWLASSAMLMAALSVGGCVTAPVSNMTAPAWVTTSSATTQQIWGIYDGLAGTTWSAPNAYTLFYRWAVPQQVLVEEFRHPKTGELAGTNIIVPGAAPGSLALTSSVAGMQWQGTLDADGSALFARDGMLKMPLRVSRTPAGELLQEKVTLSGTAVLTVDASTIYKRAENDAVATAAGYLPAPRNESTPPPLTPVAHEHVDSQAEQNVPSSQNWGVLEKISGKVWLVEGTGGRGSHSFVLKVEKSKSQDVISAYTGNGYVFEKSMDYQRSPSGGLSATGNTTIGHKTNMRVIIGANGEMVRFSDESHRDTYNLNELGELIIKRETKGWLSDTWSTESEIRLRDVTMGPEWGAFAKLAGFAWINKKNTFPTVYYDISYPEKNTIQIWIGPNNDNYWGTDGALLTGKNMTGHTESSIKNTYLLEPGNSTYTVHSPSSMTRAISERRKDIYSLIDENTIRISQLEVKDGSWQPVKEIELSREQKNEKDDRLQQWATYEQKRRDSERSTQFLNNMAALNGALTAANEVASRQVAESQASLDRTLAVVSRQAQLERATAQPTESSSISAPSTEAEQDATVAAALAQVRQTAEQAGGDPQLFAQLDEAQQLLAEKKAKRSQQAGTHKILPSKIQLSTATNSITPTAIQQDVIEPSDSMAQGKVRLCNRPGDEGPAHWPTCPQTRAEEAETRRLATSKGSGSDTSQGKHSQPSRTGSGKAPGGSGDTSQTKPPGKASTSDDEPFAWCTQNKKGFKCWGPYGPMPTEATLRGALGSAGCGNGDGDTPALGETTRFDCNIRKVKGLHGYVPEDPPDWK
ncbi:hypothetical protein D3C77_194050 [compost metagenome]